MTAVGWKSIRAGATALGAIVLTTCFAARAYGAIGDISSFPVPTPNSQPTGIAAAADGDLSYPATYPVPRVRVHAARKSSPSSLAG